MIGLSKAERGTLHVHVYPADTPPCDGSCSGQRISPEERTVLNGLLARGLIAPQLCGGGGHHAILTSLGRIAIIAHDAAVKAT